MVAVQGFEPRTPDSCRGVANWSEEAREDLYQMCWPGEGIEDPNNLFSYLNLVGNRADKVRSLAGLYKALGGEETRAWSEHTSEHLT